MTPGEGDELCVGLFAFSPAFAHGFGDALAAFGGHAAGAALAGGGGLGGSFAGGAFGTAAAWLVFLTGEQGARLLEASYLLVDLINDLLYLQCSSYVLPESTNWVTTPLIMDESGEKR
jgi:hypothetical protein